MHLSTDCTLSKLTGANGYYSIGSSCPWGVFTGASFQWLQLIVNLVHPKVIFCTSWIIQKPAELIDHCIFSNQTFVCRSKISSQLLIKIWMFKLLSILTCMVMLSGFMLGTPTENGATCNQNMLFLYKKSPAPYLLFSRWCGMYDVMLFYPLSQHKLNVKVSAWASTCSILMSAFYSHKIWTLFIYLF